MFEYMAREGARGMRYDVEVFEAGECEAVLTLGIEADSPANAESQGVAFVTQCAGAGHYRAIAKASPPRYEIADAS